MGARQLPHQKTRASIEALMRKCQVGAGGRGALNTANDLLAECYGTIGALWAEVEQRRADEAVCTSCDQARQHIPGKVLGADLFGNTPLENGKMRSPCVGDEPEGAPANELL